MKLNSLNRKIHFGHKFAKSEIKEIQRIVGEFNNIVAGRDINAYNAKRVELNLHIIQALTGGETVFKNGKYKMKFDHALPKFEQIDKICHIVDEFVNNVETPFLEAMNGRQVAGNPDDDMSIPHAPVKTGNVDDIDKLSDKKLNDAIFGANGISQLAINGLDCLKIAKFGKKARKHENKKAALIIGGWIIVATGASVAAVMIVRSKRAAKEDKVEEVDIDDIDIDIDDVDVDIDEDLDDAPVVEME